MKTNRSIFLMTAVAISPLVGVTRSFAALPVLDPKDPQATALGYTPDAAKLDPAFASRHVGDAHCGNCALYQGKPTEAQAACPLFGGKLVQNKGWCSSWVKRA